MKIIHEGSYKKVYQLDETKVLKTFAFPVGQEKLHEIRKLAEGNLHGFLPRVFRISDDEIVEEYCGGIHLSDRLHLRQIVQYWVFLLKARWARHPVDPSLENFMVTQNGLKYVDWDDQKGVLDPLSLFDLLNFVLCPLRSLAFGVLSRSDVLRKMINSHLRFYIIRSTLRGPHSNYEYLQRLFFSDEMTKIELQQLKPEQMLEACQKRFKTTHPFTEDALLTLARMSRGIFGRFLRYVILTFDFWMAQPEPREPITTETVKSALTYQRLVEDMKHELSELFPKRSDLAARAVSLLLHLQESGPQRQNQLAKALGLEPYSASGLLAKLELHRYVTRVCEGNDKIVSLTNN